MSSCRQIYELALIVGAPLTLAIVECFHPHPHDLLELDVQTWLWVHYAQIPLFPLAALAVVELVRGRTGIPAEICRVAMFVFGVGWAAWDTAAGVATGILVQAAHASGSPEAWRKPIDAIWTDPIMGGVSGAFAAFGAIALSVGTVAAGITVKSTGSSWGPVVLLALSGFGISFFRTHAWPGGPLTFAGISVAGAWLLWERARRTRS
jgi:hypothetical protein